MSRSHIVLRHFQEITYEKPSDLIIEQINSLISSGVLKPGDSLPSERALAERFRVGRGYVREAIRKLEFYGILSTLPQRKTVVANLGVKALEGLIANVLKIGKQDMESLLEAREILESTTARLATERATRKDIEELISTHEEFKSRVENGGTAIDEDLLFHLKIAEVGKNTVLRSLISLITPDIIALSDDLDSCAGGRSTLSLTEHEKILEAIINRNPKAAEAAMARHMKKSGEQFRRLRQARNTTS